MDIGFLALDIKALNYTGFLAGLAPGPGISKHVLIELSKPLYGNRLWKLEIWKHWDYTKLWFKRKNLLLFSICTFVYSRSLICASLLWILIVCQSVSSSRFMRSLRTGIMSYPSLFSSRILYDMANQNLVKLKQSTKCFYPYICYFCSAMTVTQKIESVLIS